MELNHRLSTVVLRSFVELGLHKIQLRPAQSTLVGRVSDVPCAVGTVVAV